MRKTVETETSIFSLRNILIAAGVIVLAPYVVRRMMPLFTAHPEETNANDVLVAGKDAVRDAADDYNVGGIKGTIKRGVDRVADHLS